MTKYSHSARHDPKILTYAGTALAGLAIGILVSNRDLILLSQGKMSNEPNIDMSGVTRSNPPFDATVDTVFDIIKYSDPTTFTCLEYQGEKMRQIWDKRANGEPDAFYHIYMARFNDGTNVEFIVNSEFGDAQEGYEEAMRYTKALGQIPTALRSGMKEFRVHKGEESPHGGAGSMTIYAQTTDQRLSYDHLEETIFHESVHASWDEDHAQSPKWIAAQEADGKFLTDYAMRVPNGEDLAETALFAYAISHFPKYPHQNYRMPPADWEDIEHATPNRLAYIARYLLPPDQPTFYQIAEPQNCKTKP